jgi:hypothetical protein
MFSKKRRQPDLATYQKEWDALLGKGDSTAGAFLGIFIALVLFICLISLPWTMSYLQDRGTIKPRIYFNESLELNNHLQTRTERDSTSAASDSPFASPFGQPRQQ